MWYFISGSLIASLTLFWGAGLARLLLPQPWRHLWPFWTAPVGWAFQSAVVWAGVWLNLPGTKTYALAAHVLPAALLWLSLGRRPLEGLRRSARELLAAAPILLLAVGTLAAVLAVQGATLRVLTTLTVGSCDAADYAAGARVLQEFSRTASSGFMNLPLVTSVGLTDGFFDYWLRLNHFTPSALIAFNASVLPFTIDELIGVLGANLHAGLVPVVYLVVRGLFCYRARIAALMAALYGLSPLVWYAVVQVALAQLLATGAVALLSCFAVWLWREAGVPGRSLWRWWPALSLSAWLLWGSYHFFVLACFLPVATWIGFVSWRRSAWERLWRWALVVGSAFACTGLLALPRVLGIVERFVLFYKHHFGWTIPGLGPSGWFGFVSDGDLSPWPDPVRVLLGGVVLWAVGMGWLELHRHRRLGGALACSLSILAGYFFLLAGELWSHPTASYDAYKWISVFYPLLLGGLGAWWTLALSKSRGVRLAVWSGIGGIFAANVYGLAQIAEDLHEAPLMAFRSTRAIQSIESMEDVRSVNVLTGDVWTRLWANTYLLKKPHYFRYDTYEARRASTLRGEWDLVGPWFRFAPGAAEDIRPIGPRFDLVRVGSPSHVRARIGDGWYPLEQDAFSKKSWRWTKSGGDILLRVTGTKPKAVRLEVVTYSPEKRNVYLKCVQGAYHLGHAGPQDGKLLSPVLNLAPGWHRIRLSTDKPPGRADEGDPRPVSFAVLGVTLRAEPLPWSS